jgi:hypothetical protein
MAGDLNEALLEMHYFRALVNYFKMELGETDFHVFKPTAGKENWFGFDQAYFVSKESKAIAIKSIREYLSDRANYPYIIKAFFLQFKIVEKMQRKSGNMPAGWVTPYFRSELSLKPNKQTGKSQHETLLLSASIPQTKVLYICPMIFEEDDIIRNPELDDLRMVDIQSAPVGWATNTSHHICFQETDGDPFWCSKPTEGKAVELKGFLESIPELTIDEFESFIQKLFIALGQEARTNRIENPLPFCMWVIAVPRKNQPRNLDMNT